MIGLAASGPPDGFTGDVGAEPERLDEQRLLVRERRLELGDVDRAVVDARRPWRRAGRRRLGEVAHARVVHSVRCSKPGDPHRVLAQLPGLVGAGDDHRARAVGDRRQVVPAQRRAHVVLCEQLVDVEVAGDLRVRVRLAVTPAAGRDLGHLALGDLARVDQRPGLQRGERRGVDAERREVVRVHLHRVDERRVGGRRPTRAHDHRDVDVAELQPEPRLVHRPRAVHLDVRVALRRPRADGVDVLHERERLAGRRSRSSPRR